MSGKPDCSYCLGRGFLTAGDEQVDCYCVHDETPDDIDVWKAYGELDETTIRMAEGGRY
jgi:hypothetical protein